MPGPEPGAVWIEEQEGSFVAMAECYFWTGNLGNRIERATVMLRRVKQGTWACRWCGDELPEYRRTDALYCTEGCRKRAARLRREQRNALQDV